MVASAVKDLLTEARINGGLRGDRSPARVGLTEATQMHDLVVMDQAQGHAGNVIALHLCIDIHINAGNIWLV
jgi:hypothetical protein